MYIQYNLLRIQYTFLSRNAFFTTIFTTITNHMYSDSARAGPFNQAITSHMRLSNPTDQKILFKIKTTAPKKYCVRPNCGTLEPAASVEVSSE